MDQDIIEQQLRQAEDHVADGILMLERLRVVVLRLEMSGLNNEKTRDVLRECEVDHAARVAERDRLLARFEALTLATSA